MNKWKSILLFLVGLFSQTQVQIVGFIGISEVAIFLSAPFVFWKSQRLLKRHGFMPVLILAMIWCCSALLTDWARHSTLNNLLKGFATPYAILSGVVLMHALLWDDVRRFKWAVIGMALSLILSIYVLPSGTAVGMAETQGLTAEEAFKEYKLFGVIVLGVVLTLPVKVWYMKMPKVLSIALLLFLAVYSLFAGGRSIFLIRLLSVWIILLAGRKLQAMRNVGRQTWLFLASLVIVSVVASMIYKAVVVRGYLGETELEKYENQASSRIGLLSGRAEFISALWAIKDSPFIGHGSWAVDYEGYLLRTTELIGTDRDIEIANAIFQEGRIPWIPCHSYVWQSWVWHGMAGGLFWIYIFFRVYFKTFRRCLGVFPEVFGYFAITLPVEFWNLWFSPISQRVEVSMAIALCLLAIEQENRLKLQQNPRLGGLEKRVFPVFARSRKVIWSRN